MGLRSASSAITAEPSILNKKNIIINNNDDEDDNYNVLTTRFHDIAPDSHDIQNFHNLIASLLDVNKAMK